VIRRAVVDVSHLPSAMFGHAANLWWGVFGLFAIESTMFGLLVMSYFYLRQAAPQWPPAAISWPALGVATADAAVLLASLAPMIWTHRRALRLDRRGVALGLAISTVFALASIVLRFLEFGAVHVRWDVHAYGSIVWMILGMHLVHLITSTIENVLLAALLVTSRYVEERHLVDASVNAIYWYFVVATWLPLYVIVFLVPWVA
jgi:heme/copper-type cytochrome/quinol oxidase subunit 3